MLRSLGGDDVMRRSRDRDDVTPRTVLVSYSYGCEVKPTFIITVYANWTNHI